MAGYFLEGKAMLLQVGIMLNFPRASMKLLGITIVVFKVRGKIEFSLAATADTWNEPDL